VIEALEEYMRRYLDFIGNVCLFALRAARRVMVRPFEFQMILRQIEVAGWKSLPLVLSSPFTRGLRWFNLELRQ
jgi:ABC-type transporter Mla maintaining outer membrane lipid asymmetry permease subunit MlaE